MTIKEDLTTIRVALGKIEQHLCDMNGSIKRHEAHISTNCPHNREVINNKIGKMKDSVVKNGVVLTIIQTIIVAVVVAVMTGYV